MKTIGCDPVNTVAPVAIEEYPVILRLALECIFAKATVIFYNDLAVGYDNIGLFCSAKQKGRNQDSVST